MKQTSLNLASKQVYIHPKTLDKPLVLDAEKLINGLKGQALKIEGKYYSFLENDTVTVTNVVVKGEVEIDSFDKFAHHIIISKNVEFLNKFTIEGSMFCGSFRIEGGIFSKA